MTLLAWENDPQPTVIFMYSLEGTHQRTGHQWRILQCCNFTYIPRKDRKRFAKLWVETLNRTKNPKFTYQLLERKYPYLQIAVRRYFFKPAYYITQLKEIPQEELEKAIISTFTKDFSKKVKKALLGKFKRVLRNRKKYKRTGRFPRRR